MRRETSVRRHYRRVPRKSADGGGWWIVVLMNVDPHQLTVCLSDDLAAVMSNRK